MSDEKKPDVSYFAGLDLGQAADYSALVIVERTRIEKLIEFGVRHIHRWHLGTSYTTIVAELKEMYAALPLAKSTLAIDRTGVGRGVSDMIRDSGINAACRAYTITAGSKPGAGTVPKKELVAAIQVPLQERRLTFADDLSMTSVLQKELEYFRVKVTADRNETFESWRERDHDDIVLALALALYAGRTTNFAAGAIEVPPTANQRPRSPWQTWAQ